MKTNLIALLLVLSGLICLIVAQDSGVFTDDRDGKKYKWVRIGGQIWMAENLQFDAPDRGPQNSCPNIGVYKGEGDYHPDKCGYFYDWAILMDFVEDYWPDKNYADALASHLVENPHRGIAPSGWHIPTGREINTLISYLGGSSAAARKLASEDWFGTNETGFNAEPCGEVGVS